MENGKLESCQVGAVIRTTGEVPSLKHIFAAESGLAGHHTTTCKKLAGMKLHQNATRLTRREGAGEREGNTSQKDSKFSHSFHKLKFSVYLRPDLRKRQAVFLNGWFENFRGLPVGFHYLPPDWADLNR